MNQIIPIPRCDVSFRVATLADLPFLDSLQKKHSKALGFMRTQQLEGYIEMGAVLIAESVASCQLPVASGSQRILTGN